MELKTWFVLTPDCGEDKLNSILNSMYKAYNRNFGAIESFVFETKLYKKILEKISVVFAEFLTKFKTLYFENESSCQRYISEEYF